MNSVKAVLLGLLMAWVGNTAAQAGVYIFHPGVDWYGSGLTAVYSGDLRTNTSVTNRLEAIDWKGWGYPVIAAGSWAGAEWTAPADQVVVRVEISGYHRLEDLGTPERGYAVYGGKSDQAADSTVLIQGFAADYAAPVTYSYDGKYLDIPAMNAISKLQFRSLVMLSDVTVAGGNQGYFGAINSIKITTAVVGHQYAFRADTNWFTAGMTDVNNGIFGSGLKIDTSVTNRLQAIDRQGWGYPIITAGYWAGANWAAPTDEVITKVEITGYHRADNPSDPDWGYGVYGGGPTGTPTDVTWMSGTGTEPSGGALAYSGIATRSILDGFTQLQFRSLVALKDNTVASYPIGGYGYFGAINSVTITTRIPQPDQNPAFEVPEIGHVAIDGNVSNWPASSAWSQPYIIWNGAGLPSATTRAKFAWNQAENLLYVAIQTDEASDHAGGHAVVGVSTSRTNAAYTGDGATQLAFDIVSGNTVNITNEIDYYAGKYNHSWPGWHSGTQDVQAAFSVNNDIYTYEIAIPLWTNWVTMTQKTTLSVGDVLYLYSILQNKLEGSNGTNLTYNGNPNFAMTNGFKFASALTLGPTVILPTPTPTLTPTPTPTPTLIPGDASRDGKVDVSDLGILAANYGGTGKTWDQGDFTGDGKVDVSDLGILAAHYGTGTGSSLDFNKDAAAFGLSLGSSDTATAQSDDTPVTNALGCGSAGLPLIAGLLLLGLCLVKLDE